jgi:hypothetical protein
MRIWEIEQICLLIGEVENNTTYKSSKLAGRQEGQTSAIERASGSAKNYGDRTQ